MGVLDDFRKALTDISYARAGWDFLMSAERRAEERKIELEGLMAARAIWADNTEIRSDLKDVFINLGPLATIGEIE